MNKFVLIPHEEYIRFKDYLLKNKAKDENNEPIRDKSQIHSSTTIDKNKIQGYEEATSTNSDILSGIRTNSVIDQDITDVLPPPVFLCRRQSLQFLLLKIYNRKDMESEGIGSQNGKKISDDTERYLIKIYHDTRNPASYSRIEKLYNYVKSQGKKKISNKQIRVWLSKQEPYTAHRPVRRYFRRPRVLAFSKNYQWDSDTANMTSYQKQNDNYSYFTVFIDIFTRYLFTYPLKTLTGVEIVEVMQKVMEKQETKPKILRTDQGSEYKNKQVEKFLSQEKIKHVFTYYETKANYAERVIKTIKLKNFKYFTAKETYRWIDQLENITITYNNSKHRSIKMSPTEAKSVDNYELWRNQYHEISAKKGADDKKNSNKKFLKARRFKTFKYKIGDRVKISFLKEKFDREYSQKWSKEVFTVIDRKFNQGFPMYILKDYNNDIIKSYFYEPEFQLAYIGEETEYKIEKIIKRRTQNKQKEILVKWKGWPEKFNSWISEKSLRQ